MGKKVAKSEKKRKFLKLIGKSLPKPDMLELGDVVAIQLNDGRYAYARRYGKVSLGILSTTPTQHLLSLEELKQQVVTPVFYVEFYEPTDNPTWIYLGNWPFIDAESSKSPPVYIQDIGDPSRVRILDNGVIRQASVSEIGGLKKHQFLPPDAIVVLIEGMYPSNLAP